MVERDRASDFELPDQHGNPVRLSGLRGNVIVLYFQPDCCRQDCTAPFAQKQQHGSDRRYSIEASACRSCRSLLDSSNAAAGASNRAVMFGVTVLR